MNYRFSHTDDDAESVKKVVHVQDVYHTYGDIKAKLFIIDAAQGNTSFIKSRYFLDLGLLPFFCFTHLGKGVRNSLYKEKLYPLNQKHYTCNTTIGSKEKQFFKIPKDGCTLYSIFH